MNLSSSSLSESRSLNKFKFIYGIILDFDYSKDFSVKIR